MKKKANTNDPTPIYTFIKLARKTKQHWLWKASLKKSKFEAWLDLLFRANFEDNKEPFGHDLIELKRGELLCSQEGLAKDWMWDRSAVRIFLKTLQKDGMISLKVTNKYTVITLCNYATYNDKQPTTQHQDNIKTTSTQHQDNTYKNLENNKEEKEIAIEPFSEDFRKEWERWTGYKKHQWKFAYKTLDSEQTAFSELLGLSKEDETKAKAIIEQSIAKGWKGLFEIKSDTNGYVIPMHGQSVKTGTYNPNDPRHQW